MDTHDQSRTLTKIVALAAASFLFALMLALAGCGNSGAGATLSEAVEGDTATAIVKSVDGNTVTVSLMEGMQGGPGQGGPAPAGGDQAASGSSDNQAASETDDSSANDNSNDNQDAQSGAADAGNDQPPAKPGDDGSSTDDQAASNGNGAADASGSQPPAKPGEDGSGSGSAPGGEPPAKPGDDGSSTDDQAASNGNGAADASGSQPPAKPGEDGSGSGSAPGGEPPAKPDEDGSGNGVPSGEPPAMPEGAAPDGQGGMPMPGGTEATLTISNESIIFTSSDGSEVQGSISDIAEGSMLTLSVNGTNVTKIVVGSGMGPGGQGGPGDGQGGPGGGSSTVSNGTGATTYDADASTDGETYESTTSDENALRVENGATVTAANATVTKTGDSSSSEDSDFYGLNAGVLAYDGSTLTLTGANITTDSKGSNGVFAYGEGTTVNVSDSTIKCSQGNSGGVELAGGATLNASNLTVETQGESSASIRSDRGGGTENVNGGTYTTHGKHSPAVYSTADVTVNDATLLAENCEVVVIEGLNSVTLNDVDATANVNNVATRTGISNGIMIYQSMSGDAEEGTGTFTMKGGSLKNTSDTLIYSTNTAAAVTLEDVDIDNTGALLVAAGNDGQWGKEGSNGSDVTLTAVKQVLSGDITVDDISTLALSLTQGSSYSGAINSGGAAGTVDVTLADGSTWTLTGDSYVSSLSGDTSGIDLAGHTLYVNGKAWTA